MNEETWDLAVVGAGPAGSTAALAALAQQPTARVLLLDRTRFPRDKSCGDGIAPHVLDVLAPLGADDVVDGWRPLQRLELSRGRRTVEGQMARPVRVVPREVFDARLVDHAVAAGARLVQHRVRDVRVEDGAVVLDGRFRARVVVAADGARSAVRTALAGPRRVREAIAIRGYAPTPPGRAGRQLIRYGEGRSQPSYAWAFDRGDGISNVGYGELLGGPRQPSRGVLLDQLEQLLPGTVPQAERWRGHHLPLSGWGWRTEQPDGPVLYAGDAAGLVNPMTGEGIYYAVATGAVAGRTAMTCVADHAAVAAGARHRAAVRALLEHHLRHTWLAGRLTRHPQVVEAGITAAGRDQHTFDDLVELGLGDGRLTPRLVASLGAGLIRNQLTPMRG
ncbi:geranylgeranyl reductase family protein [Janibacter cremeus]|uniref:geranylgeranyl reductase family protein n=1 Tax=Janibacter cremeus TaxID=1285192 RepID=UPI0023F83F7D|nr:geranylgeranyl reductase family protein [Janibacter cremeus]WEV78548.1 geranylgeranyl reductase family protein [Janibacter cremeus]